MLPNDFWGILPDRTSVIKSLLAALVLVGAQVVSSPSTDCMLESGHLWTSFSGNEIAETIQISSEPIASSWTNASIPKEFQDEVEIAHRVLEEFRNDVELNEFDAYLHNLEMIARSVPKCTSVREANVVARGLRTARASLIEQVTSFANWTRIVRAIDPDESQRHAVPQRFIQVRAPIEEPPLILSDETAQWDRALDMFMGTDADSTSARS